MGRIAYTVRATLPTAAAAAAYAAWLLDGHVQAVLAAGASDAAVIRLDAPPDATGWPVEARYAFADRAGYDRYVREHAPRLRAEGLARFGPESGIAFQRTVGEIL